MAEVVKIAGNSTRDHSKKLIKRRHILLAIREDEDSAKKFEDGIIPSSGTVSFLHSVLESKKQKSVTKKMETANQ